MNTPRWTPSLTVAFALGLTACGDTPIEDRPIDFERDAHWPARAFLPEQTGPRLVVTNSGDDTLSFIDATTYEAIAKVPVGFFPIEPEGPHHLQVSRDGRFLFVGISNFVVRATAATGPHGSHGSGTSDGYLLKIDAATGREVARARVRRNPGDVRIGPDGHTVFQSHFDVATVVEGIQKGLPRSELDSYLVGTDGDSMQRNFEARICPAGHGIAFSPDGAFAYVACWMSDQLAVVKLATGEVERVLIGPMAGAPPAPRYQPYALTVSPADGRVFVGSTGPGLVGLDVYDPRAGDFVPEAHVSTTGAPQFGQFTRDGARFFVVTQRPDRLLVIDPATSAIVREAPLGDLGCLNAHLAALAPDESRVFVVCEGNHIQVPGSFHVLEGTTLAAMRSVTLGLYPDDLALLPLPPRGAQ